MAKSDLPFGSEFSPSQIDLVQVLELAHKQTRDQSAAGGQKIVLWAKKPRRISGDKANLKSEGAGAP